MAIITLAGNAQWSGDSNGHGGVLLYDANNRPIYPVVTGAYTAFFEIRHTSAAAAGTVSWDFMWPSGLGTLKAFVKRVSGVMCFDGTAASATTLRYALHRAKGGASSGGLLVGAEPKSTAYPASGAAFSVQQITAGTGLTTVAILDNAPTAVIALPASVTGGVVHFDWRFDEGGELDSNIQLAGTEHLFWRLQTQAAVIGLGLYGFVEWDER